MLSRLIVRKTRAAATTLCVLRRLHHLRFLLEFHIASASAVFVGPTNTQGGTRCVFGGQFYDRYTRPVFYDGIRLVAISSCGF